jgi:hypothetical protein
MAAPVSIKVAGLNIHYIQPSKGLKEWNARV